MNAELERLTLDVEIPRSWEDLLRERGDFPLAESEPAYDDPNPYYGDERISVSSGRSTKVIARLVSSIELGESEVSVYQLTYRVLVWTARGWKKVFDGQRWFSDVPPERTLLRVKNREVVVRHRTVLA